MLINNQQQRQQISLNNQQQQSQQPLQQTSPPPPQPCSNQTNFEGNNFNLNSQQPIPLFGGGLGGNGQQQLNNNLFNSVGGIFSTTTLNQQNQNNLNNVGVENRQINGQTIPGAWFFPPQQSAELDTKYF
uniref:Uncharacterized protein n=1 Tax=Meloidogyne enterolobii TaxID=390850 RepID=A0A6V7Y6N2_MELEN|nr:unnamed protein product [Meloidogyne enterolobii]